MSRTNGKSVFDFYSTGDRVQVGGIKGDVIDIGMLRTTMLEIGQWVDADLYNGRVVDYKRRRITKDRLFTRLMEEVDQTGNRVALASATFHLVETPEIRVKLVGPTAPGSA